MKRKKVLIDLYSLENPFCGFGQIAVNYAKLFAEIQRSGKEEFDIVFLLPDCYRHRPLKEFEGVECLFRETKIHHMFHIIPNKLPKVDVWHAVNQFCRTYPDSLQAKLIYTIHDLNFLFEEDAPSVSNHIKTLQSRIDRAECVTFISNYAESISRQHLNLRDKDTRVIYNGVEDLASRIRKKPDFVKEEKPFFFCIGQFLEKKNFHLLVDVMKSFPDTELYMCGECHTPYGLNILRDVAKKGIDNITIANNIPDEERIWLYENCQAYMFPSAGEGFGLPMIEAMLFGKPVFISKAQSLPEIGGGNAFIWKDLTTETMVATIKKGLDTFYKDKAAPERIKTYARSFSYRKHVDSYIALYREVLGL